MRHGHPASTAGPLSRRGRGGVRGYKLPRVRSPLTPPSPCWGLLGRGSPAVPQIESVLITKACVEMNGTCFSCRGTDDRQAGCYDLMDVAGQLRARWPCAAALHPL